MERGALALLIVLMAASLAPAASAQPFVAEEAVWYLTGHANEQRGVDALLMDDVPADDSSPTDGAQVPLLETAGAGSDTYQWMTANPYTDARQIVSDVEVVIHFSVQLQASAEVHIALRTVAPDGSIEELARDVRTVTAAQFLPSEERFFLDAEGQTLPEGHLLLLDVHSGGLSVLPWARYGTQDEPSRISSLPSALLDTDGDGVGDSQERRLGTDPTRADSDGDGASDGHELAAGSNPRDNHDIPEEKSDRDRDGLPDGLEASLGTNPDAMDTDGDGYSDGMEWRLGTDPTDAGSVPADRDLDGLPDAVDGAPDQADADGDGVLDCHEDDDMDGLTACQEAAHGTNPFDDDSDDDGVTDGDEVNAGTVPVVDSFTLRGGPDIAEPLVAAGVFFGGTGLIAFALVRRYRL